MHGCVRNYSLNSNFTLLDLSLHSRLIFTHKNVIFHNSDVSWMFIIPLKLKGNAAIHNNHHHHECVRASNDRVMLPTTKHKCHPTPVMHLDLFEKVIHLI